MGLSNGIITAPVGVDDVRRALGIGSTDVGTLCTSSKINNLARYKPIRKKTFGLITISDRASARYGFQSITPSWTTSDSGYNEARYVYETPRGASSTPIEPYRITDFANCENQGQYGYNHHAVSPFAFFVSGTIDSNTTNGNGSLGIALFINSGVNGYYANEGSSTWDEITCLEIDDLIGWHEDGSYIGFSIQDLDSAYHCNVLTRYQLRSLPPTVPTVVLYAVARTTDGRYYPEVSFLHDANRSGHNFRVRAFLYSQFGSFTYNGTTYNENNAEYRILSNNISVNSLEFNSPSDDSRELVLKLFNTIAEFSAVLVQNAPTTIALTYLEDESVSGVTYHKYKVSGNVCGIVTAPSSFHRTSIRYKVTAGSGTGHPYSPIQSQTRNFEKEGTISISAGQTVGPTVIAQPDFYVYFEPGVPVSSRYITVSAVLIGESGLDSEKIMFTNTLTIKATS